MERIYDSFDDLLKTVTIARELSDTELKIALTFWEESQKTVLKELYGIKINSHIDDLIADVIRKYENYVDLYKGFQDVFKVMAVCGNCSNSLVDSCFICRCKLDRRAEVEPWDYCDKWRLRNRADIHVGEVATAYNKKLS